MDKRLKKAAAFVLTVCMIFTTAACGQSESKGNFGNATRLMSDSYESAELVKLAVGCPVGWENRIWDFSLELLEKCFTSPNDDDGEAAGRTTDGTTDSQSLVLSPLSLMQLLIMLDQGAEGETSRQIEAAVGTEVLLELEKIQELLSRTENGLTVKTANSAWFRDEAERLSVSDSYVGILQKYFDAEAYLAPFDKSTVRDINRWCGEKTDGRIDKIIEKISDSAVVYLINALSFDAEWKEKYRAQQIHECDFTHEDGSTEKVEMMYSTESRFLENEWAKGFVKPYKGGYSFAAVLPKDESMKMSDFLGKLDSASMSSLLSQKVMTNDTGERFYLDSFELESGDYAAADMWEVSVAAGIPKFKTEYGSKLKSILEAMGVCDLFDENAADLSGMATSAEGNIFVSEIQQKAVIETDAEGTRAAAVSFAEMDDGAAMIEETVYLDRPFVYAIIDDETQIPIFVGVMTGNEL